MIGCWCDKALVDKIDCARRPRTRSEFCREAIAEKLRRLGFDITEDEVASPDRAGKARRRQAPYPTIPRHAAQLNEPGSGSTAAARKHSRRNPAPGGASKSK
jgi:hypothetical protein